MTENQIKADAINEFVCSMIGALESGFVDGNNPTLAEVHRVAHYYVKDNYGVELPSIVEQWGKDTTKECGFKTGRSEKQMTKQAFKGMIKQDAEWLQNQPESHERTHIECILDDAVNQYYT